MSEPKKHTFKLNLKLGKGAPERALTREEIMKARGELDDQPRAMNAGSKWRGSWGS